MLYFRRFGAVGEMSVQVKSSGKNPVVARYVQSLYKVAKNSSLEKEVADSLFNICYLIKSQQGYVRMLSRFSLIPKEAINFVNVVTESVKCHPILLNFLKVLACNKRFGLIEEICQGYLDYLKKIQGTKTVFVTYAKDFSDDDKNSLVANLKEVLGCDSIECVLKKDSALIDGIQVRYGSRMLDYSIKSKLARLHETIRRSSYAN